jgi:hypothetical protein
MLEFRKGVEEGHNESSSAPALAPTSAADK